jgi:hypothetical protein
MKQLLPKRVAFILSVVLLSFNLLVLSSQNANAIVPPSGPPSDPGNICYGHNQRCPDGHMRFTCVQDGEHDLCQCGYVSSQCY